MLLGFLIVAVIIVCAGLVTRLLRGPGITDNGIGLSFKLKEVVWDVKMDEPEASELGSVRGPLVGVKLEVKFGGVVANTTMSLYDKLSLADSTGTERKSSSLYLDDFFATHPQLPSFIKKDEVIEGWLVFEYASGQEPLQLWYRRGAMASIAGKRAITEYSSKLELKR